VRIRKQNGVWEGGSGVRRAKARKTCGWKQKRGELMNAVSRREKKGGNRKREERRGRKRERVE